MLEEVLSANVFGFFLVFARLGGALMIIPGFGELMVPPRVRLSLGLALAMFVFPLISGQLPGMPASLSGLFALIVTELMIGVFIGAAARLIMSALHVAGTVISFQSSLGFAQVFDPTARTQGAIVVTLMNLLGLVLVFSTGLHRMLIRALVDSYVLFPPAAFPPMGDFAELAVNFVAKSFALGFQIAAPFVIYGVIFYVCLGLLGRLMPRVQPFVIVMPLQILLSLTLLMIVMPAIMLWYLDHFEASMAGFLVSS